MSNEYARFEARGGRVVIHQPNLDPARYYALIGGHTYQLDFSETKWFLDGAINGRAIKELVATPNGCGHDQYLNAVPMLKVVHIAYKE